MEKTVSVIIPIYNVEDYLPRCVDSVLRQTYPALEIILVDDGSPDGCGTICDGYAKKDPRVRVIHKPNGGLSDARNAGMAIATGSYLMFVDSDDILTTDAVALLWELSVKEDADLVIGHDSRFYDDPIAPVRAPTPAYTVMSPTEAMADMLRTGCSAWARLYRRHIHADSTFPVGEINEDEAIVLSILERCNKIVRTKEVIYHYRCRPESITTTSFSLRQADWYYHCLANHRWLQERYPDLIPLSLNRLGSSIVYLLHRSAFLDQPDEELLQKLLCDLRCGYPGYQRNCLSGKRGKLQMWCLRFLPYSWYRTACRIIKPTRRD